jgi:hypothetical protein
VLASTVTITSSLRVVSFDIGATSRNVVATIGRARQLGADSHWQCAVIITADAERMCEIGKPATLRHVTYSLPYQSCTRRSYRSRRRAN